MTRWLLCSLVLAACGDNVEPPLGASEPLALSTREDEPVELPLDDSDLDMHVVSAPAHGTVLEADARYQYVPAPNFDGDDVFTIELDGTSTRRTVHVHVDAVEDAPNAVDDVLAAGFETPLAISSWQLLGNDADVDDDSLALFEVNEATHGTVTLDGDGILFIPDTGFEGIASFVYTVDDGSLASHALVTITVGANAAPIARADQTSVAANSVVQIPDSVLLANDTDSEPQTLAITNVYAAEHGSVSHTLDRVTFIPDVGFAGPATFQYEVSDGYKTSVATVTVDVAAN